METTNDIRYAVIASCMTPRGAWAKSLGGGDTESFCRHQFNLAGFHRPETGIVWGLELSLVKISGNVRETLATRKA